MRASLHLPGQYHQAMQQCSTSPSSSAEALSGTPVGVSRGASTIVATTSQMQGGDGKIPEWITVHCGWLIASGDEARRHIERVGMLFHRGRSNESVQGRRLASGV